MMPLYAQAVNAPAAGALVKTPVFDVSSVKPNKSGSGSLRISRKDDRFAATNLTLKSLIANAYGIREDLISGGPAWVEATHFDLVAKVVEPDAEALKQMTREQRQAMLRPVLAERFGLKVHVEVKVLPVYEIRIAKGGPKFKEADAGDTGKNAKGVGMGSMRIYNSEMSAHGVALEALTANLASRVHRPVLDKTGLTGRYDLELTWAPDDGSPAASDSSAPSIFTALQEQLGLKLESAKGPIETLVIDRADLPTED